MTVNTKSMVYFRQEPLHLISGCPCLRTKGKQKICVNGDDSIPVKKLSLSPSFFSKIESFDELVEFESATDQICYFLLHLSTSSNTAYCVSRGKRIRIAGNDVSAIDIQEAHAFTQATRNSSDDGFCSSCLYKYIVNKMRNEE